VRNKLEEKWEKMGIHPDKNGCYPTEEEFKLHQANVKRLDNLDYDKPEGRERFNKIIEMTDEFENRFC